MWVQNLKALAITTFETEISNFFAIDFSKTSYAKEPIEKRKVAVMLDMNKILSGKQNDVLKPQA